MATTLGGWYLNGSKLEYRLGNTSTGTVLASITGLTNLTTKSSDTGDAKNKAYYVNGDTLTELGDAYISIEETGNGTSTSPGTGTFKIADAILGTAKVSVSGSTNYTATMDFASVDKKVHLNGTETITYNSSGGSATITGNLTAGFTLAKDGKSATYSDAKTNQTLATITGLAKNYTATTSTDNNAVSTVKFENSTRDPNTGVVTAGTITLSKVADTKNATASTISALGTGAITVNNQAIATNNGINYYLKLGEKKAGDYKQQDSTDEAAYWTVKGTTATYQYYSPTGYELTNAKNEVIDKDGKVYKADGTAYGTNEGDSNATKIKVTAAKTTTVATVTGLANDITTNITDEKVATARENVSNTRSNSIADAVGVGQARITSGDGAFVSGITVTTGVSSAETNNNKPVYESDGKTLKTAGEVTINITRAVLPTKGNVVVTPGKGFKVTATTNTTSGTNDFYTNEQAGAESSNVVKNQRIWVINGNTAVYKEVDLAYYTKTEDENKGTTTIACTVQKDVATLATIKGLNADWLADESHLTRNTTDTNGVITHIDGINITKTAVYTTNNSGKLVPDTRVATNVGEITLSSEVLDGMNATITKSDHYRLALQKGSVTAADSTADKTARSDVTLPAFNNYKWNLSGTTATLKGDIATAGYTLSDDSKTVTYTAAAKNQTLATVSGLKKGTQLERDSETTSETEVTYRKIGNYVGATFTDGLAINGSGALSHKTEEDNKTLKRLPITISRLVMDTSKISLTSNFFTLELNKDSSLTTDSDKVNSRVYVLEKNDLYDNVGKANEAVKTGLEGTVGWHGSLGSTAILKQALPAYYTTVADAAGTIKTINYTKPGTATTLATVKGLNSAINENDIEFNTTDKTITIKSVDALTTGNVTITNPTGTAEDTMYHLELETGGTTGIGEAKLSNETWEQTGTTVNYTALVTSPGYKLNADKNLITYTKEATTTSTTLATITGLRAGLAKVDPSTTQNSGSDPGDTPETDQTSRQYSGVTFDNKTGTITIGKEALNSSNIAIKGSANYKLALAAGLDTATAPDAVTRWVISGTTATYKTVIPDYYTYNASNNTITYTKTVDAKYQDKTSGKADYSTDESNYDKNGKGKTIPAFGTIKGLKSNLVVSDDGQSIGYYDNGTLVEKAITLATTADANGKYAITIKDAGVLNGTTVSLDATAIANKYTLALDSDLIDDVKPKLVQVDTDEDGIADSDKAPEWSISRGTATLKGDIQAGYSNNSNGTQIDFSAAKNGATIATITGLNSTLTTVGANDLTFGENDGTTDNTNVITVANNMLSTSDVKLTTNIAILGKDYKLALGNGTKQLSDVDTDAAGKLNKWSIDKTTATYYTWRDTYYSLNNKTGEASDTITYHAAGEGLKTGDDILAKVEGLASGLVTIQGDQIRGITVGKNDNGFTADNKNGTIIQLSSNVLPTTIGSTVQVTPAEGKSYTLILDGSDSSIPTPVNDIYYDITTTGVATVKIKKAISAGFAYENASDKNTIKYKAEDLSVGGVIGTISGLDKNTTVINSEGDIEGITITDDKKIKLSSKVLNGDVTFTTSKGSGYTLELGEGVTGATSDPILEKNSKMAGQFDLRAGATNGGYTLKTATTEGDVTTQKIAYMEGGNTGSIVASITGLKNNDKDKVTVTAEKNASTGAITGYIVTISADALNAKDVKITAANSYSGNLKLALNNVAASKATDTWDLTNGTATFTHKVTAGYALKDSNAKEITYTPESSIVSTLNNLSKEATVITQDDCKTLAISKETDNTTAPATTTYKGITFEEDATDGYKKGTFTVTDESVLAHKSVKLTTKVTGKDSSGANITADYSVDLATGIKATTAAPVWNKAAGSNVATYTATTAAGYTISGDNKNIVYNSDPTTATLATVNGLSKESVAKSEGSAIGIETKETDESNGAETTTFTKGLEVTTSIEDGNGTGVITIGKNVLNNAKVSLANSDNYTFTPEKTGSNAVPTSTDAAKVWAISGTTATYKNVTPAHYALDTGSKSFTYTAQKDVTGGTIATIKGLKSGLKLDESGNVINADGTTTDGITIKDNGTVLLNSAVLGTSKEITSDTKPLELASGIKTIKEEATEWVGSGTTYTYKKYDKAYFTYDSASDNKKITYTAATTGTTYATISNLASDATITFVAADNDNLAKGGTVKISANQLIEKDVTLKVNSGTFALAFADGFTAKSSIDDDTLKWGKTNATTAVLQGTKTAGYTLSEDAKSITYKKTDGTVTLATISGLKSGFELPASTTFTTDSSGNQIITLDKTMLGTANVTLKGDGYKLKLAEDVASETDKATWVKATNATKATFTQQTYNGFTESADGKSLTYIKNTSKIDLATINGLSKDLTTDNMKVVYADGSKTAETAKTEATAAISEDGTLVVLDDVNKVIYLKQDALSGKVTLANKDGYTFALVNDSNASVTELGGTEITDADPKVTFNNGTMSIVAGTDDKWVLSDDKKTLNYTAAKYNTLATVSNLPKDLDISDITLEGTTIKIAKTALVNTDETTSKETSRLANNAKITLANKKVGDTIYEYSIALDDLTTVSAAPAASKKVWALSGTNLSLKEVTAAYYLDATTTSNNIKTQTITYVAEKVGSEIAKVSGLPSGVVKQSSDGQTVYVGDDINKAAFTTEMNDLTVKTIEVGSDLRTAISTADKAVTLSLTGTGYTFTNNSKGEAPKDGQFNFIDPKSFTALKSGGKATVINEKSSGWTEDSTDTKLVFAKSADSVVATVNGLRKDFAPSGATDDDGNQTSNSNDLAFDSKNKLITVGSTALTNAGVTLTIPSKGEVYNLALADNVASSLRSLSDTPTEGNVADWTDNWMNQTDWVVSGGTASYKTYNKANYYIKPATNASTTPNSIAYNAPTAGTTYAKISGLSKTAESVASSVALSAYSSKVDAGEDIIITLGAKELSTSKVTLAVSKANSVKAANTNDEDLKPIVESIASDLNDKIVVGNKVAPNFKLALNLDDTSDDSVTASSVKSAVWDNNGTVANLTGTITKGYKLSNDQKSITYQAADSKLQVIAKVSGIKKDSQILDSNVTADTSNAALPNLKKITLTNEHLGTSNVVLTGEGYKLALDAYDATNNPNGTVITDDNADIWTNATEWVANNGTFTYKTYNKAHYRVNDTGMQVISTAAKDDKNNAYHKTYAQITGLSKTADASALNEGNALATTTKGGKDASYAITSITTANDGVITLTSDLLNKGNIKLTDSKISASLQGMPVLYTGGYTLALHESLSSSKSTASSVNATVSGTKATWSGTQGAGYLLANDEQNVTYYSAKKDKQTIATVTGLNASVTAENSNDSLSSSYNATTNVMTLTKDKLSTNVGISGTVAYNFSDFENGTITGSGSADKVSIAGVGVSINAGGGNDIVEFTDSSRTKGNIFLYANGNGDDVIKGFTANDVIKVTNVVGTTSTSKKVGDNTVYTYKNNIEVYTDVKNEEDTLVKVNNNVIRLKGYKSNVTVYDSKGNHWDATETNGGQTNNGSFVADTTPQTQGNVLADDDYAMTPQNLFADDNYAMTPDLSSIVKSSTSSDYATDDLVADDATALTKQSTAVSYSDKK